MPDPDIGKTNIVMIVWEIGIDWANKWVRSVPAPPWKQVQSINARGISVKASWPAYKINNLLIVLLGRLLNSNLCVYDLIYDSI